MTSQLIRSEGNIRIWSLLGSGDMARIEAMLNLYAELLPQYAHYIPRIRRRTEWGAERRSGHIVHYWLLEVDGEPVAFHTFRYVHKRRVGLSHALAVKPAYRNIYIRWQPLSMYLLHSCLDQIVEDAGQLGNDSTYGVVSEVEPSGLMDRYMENGVLELPLAYMKPVFPAEQPGRTRMDEIALAHFVPMFLGILPDPGRGVPFYTSDLIANFALAFLIDHYGLPVEHRQVQAVLGSIPPVFKKESIPQEIDSLPYTDFPITRPHRAVMAQIRS